MCHRADLTSLGDKQLTDLRRDRIGFVFQAFNLVPTLTAEQKHPAAVGDRGS
jgi:putative ABC transport system ATP-binding protein